MSIESSKRHFINQSAQLGVLRVVGAAVSLLVNLVLARRFYAEEVGQYFISLSVVILVAQLSTLGSEKLLVRNISATKSLNKIKEHISLAFCLTFLGSLLTYSLYQLLLLNVFDITQNLNVIDIYIIAIVFLLMAILQANNKAPIAIFFQFVFQPIIFIILLYEVTKPPIQLFLMSMTISALVISTYLVLAGHLRFGRFSFYGVIQALQRTFPYLIAALIGLLVTQLALPLSSLWLEDSDIAVMGIVMRLINVLFFIVTGARMLLLPRFSSSISNNNENAINMLRYWGSILPGGATVCSVILYVFFSQNIMVLFGEYYVNDHYLLVVASLMLIPVAFMGWAQSYLIALNRMDMINVSSLVSAIITFSTLVIFTPIYGVWASVIALVGGKMIYSIVTLFLSYKLI
ncbi:lipopolysaccharide biosynthesis protein [Vibrio genomosp. F10 str. 9ZC157]|uniref:Capsular biosynthesis protein n=1 Tax=Vibrio genomosp. F10 str. ZF-129 TaxID=1187848 RepID=A0A1E5BDD0_9VIBR|nr:hypothetical protein [Vibrio genomosp. F10]OEE33148.1 hypothetical protein A1QO_10735 [Vibrio genomosp. F10 str. ZF-129]OEE95649.1 hypothetical protein A1QM_04735 [Vibrio genomosp. F10 str. 9ZC157]